jgi:hypothetical protein
VSERVPPDPLCDPDFGCGWTDYRSHQALSPVGPQSSRRWARENPVVRLAELRVLTPHFESLREAGVKRNRFLRCFRLARTNDLEHDGPCNADLISLEVDRVRLFWIQG